MASLKSVYPLGAWKLGGIDPFRGLRAELLRRMKKSLEQTTFSPRAKVAFSRAMTIRVSGMGVQVLVHHPGWIPLTQGRRRGQMTWLTKAQKPIPIVTDTGEVIFRSATPKTMSSGKWVHPGKAPVSFEDKARVEVRKFVREKLAQVVAGQLRRALGR